MRRPDRPLVWLHGASVGETVTLLPLVARLQKRGLTVLVTSGTVTSAKLLAARLPAGVIHQYLPLDVPRYMRRFLDYWQPSLGLICESEIWPNLLIEARKREVPLVLVNARMSERSFARWYKAPRPRASCCPASNPASPSRKATPSGWRSSAHRASASPATSNSTCPPRRPMPTRWPSSTG